MRVSTRKNYSDFSIAMALLVTLLTQNAFAEPATVGPYGLTVELGGSYPADAQFGISVAISGDVAIIAAPTQPFMGIGAPGVTTVFYRDAEGWSYGPQLSTPQHGYDFNSYLGCDGIAIDGDTVVVGSSDATVGPHASQGAALVFVRSGSAWNLQQTLSDPMGSTFDGFGCGVGISGNTIVIGAPGYGSNGAGYVFKRAGTTWTLQKRLTATDGAAGDQLGFAASIAQDTVLLGAPHKASDQGAAYVFENGTSGWVQRAKLVASDKAAGDQFGASVAMTDGIIVVGAPNHSTPTTIAAGKAYVFEKPDASWVAQSALVSATELPNGNFGSAVAVNAKRLVVGELGNDAAHVYKRAGSTWTEYALLGDSTHSRFGGALSISGTTIVGGSYRARNGDAYVFDEKDVIFEDSFE